MSTWIVECATVSSTAASASRAADASDDDDDTKERVFFLAGTPAGAPLHRLAVRELTSFQEGQLGGSVWPASVALAQWIQRCVERIRALCV